MSDVGLDLGVGDVGEVDRPLSAAADASRPSRRCDEMQCPVTSAPLVPAHARASDRPRHRGRAACRARGRRGEHRVASDDEIGIGCLRLRGDGSRLRHGQRDGRAAEGPGRRTCDSSTCGHDDLGVDARGTKGRKPCRRRRREDDSHSRRECRPAADRGRATRGRARHDGTASGRSRLPLRGLTSSRAWSQIRSPTLYDGAWPGQPR